MLTVVETAAPPTKGVRLLTLGVRLKLGWGTTSVRLVVSVTVGLVPVTRIEYVPGTVVVVGLKVRVLVVLVEAALKEAVMPTGSPDTVIPTLLLKLFTSCTLMTELTLEPPTRAVRLGIDEDRLKYGTGMVMVSGAVMVVVPEVATRVRGLVPGAAALDAVNFRVLVLPDVDTAMVTPAGKLATSKPTAALKLPTADTVTDMLAEPD
jgi:hypothetical protein